LNYTNIKKEFEISGDMICSKCGEDKAKLFDIVSEEGIVSTCIDCLQDDEVPVVKKSLDSAFENTKKSVYERLSSVAGIDLSKHRRFEERIKEKETQNDELKEIVNSRFKDNFVQSVDINNSLVRNFHWIIMRARRLRKLTLPELSRKIAEPEEVLKNIEKGIGGNFELINKLETYFGIYLLTEEARKNIETIPEKKIGFDPVTTQSLTIDDLREMKKKKEAKVFEDIKEESIKKVEEVVNDNSKDLTQEEIDDLIFGRR
jgi:ribosome-binding protein aMBF1 (putative translation factor)